MQGGAARMDCWALGRPMLQVGPSSPPLISALLALLQAKLLGAVEVPLFIVDDDNSPAGLLKQASNFGMGGWWLGGSHMKSNPQFMAEVQVGAALPYAFFPLIAPPLSWRRWVVCCAMNRGWVLAAIMAGVCGSRAAVQRLEMPWVVGPTVLVMPATSPSCCCRRRSPRMHL